MEGSSVHSGTFQPGLPPSLWCLHLLLGETEEGSLRAFCSPSTVEGVSEANPQPRIPDPQDDLSPALRLVPCHFSGLFWNSLELVRVRLLDSAGPEASISILAGWLKVKWCGQLCRLDRDPLLLPQEKGEEASHKSFLL